MAETTPRSRRHTPKPKRERKHFDFDTGPLTHNMDRAALQAAFDRAQVKYPPSQSPTEIGDKRSEGGSDLHDSGNDRRRTLMDPNQQTHTTPSVPRSPVEMSKPTSLAVEAQRAAIWAGFVVVAGAAYLALRKFAFKI